MKILPLYYGVTGVTYIYKCVKCSNIKGFSFYNSVTAVLHHVTAGVT